MVIEIGTTRGYSANLTSLKIIRSLLTIILDSPFDASGLPEEPYLNEISILSGGNRMADALKAADRRESKKHIYIVTQNKADASDMEDALLFWVYQPDQLRTALKKIDPSLGHICWEGPHFEMLAEDILDVLAASALILPDEITSRSFRGNMSWVES